MMFSVAGGLNEKESIVLRNKIRTKNNDNEIIKTGEVKNWISAHCHIIKTLLLTCTGRI